MYNGLAGKKNTTSDEEKAEEEGEGEGEGHGGVR